LLVVLAPRRGALAIFPLGLIGCLIAGLLNGVGSLFFYVGLARIDAGVGQMLFGLYPLWVALLLYLDGQRPSRASLGALALGVPAVYLITGGRWQQVDPVGAGLMLLAGIMFALHLPINERVLYEVPAPTVAFYTLAAMTIVVVPAYLLFSESPGALGPQAVPALLSLTAITFISRLALFSGVKSIGGFQSSLLGVAEVLVAVALAHIALGESLTAAQTFGGLLLAVALLACGLDRSPYRRVQGRGWLYWLRPPVPLRAAPLPTSPESAAAARLGSPEDQAS
jgi:drug/metabolite transporter (DMT)-like permease